ncbi:3-oxo-5-alpha-steroid 4-dehydrogenase 3 [Sporothrix schenckii 1099-18]|uniref:Polyprenal reductase n=2 Tax=Sporothrix schenckii TaxID=29908 RepID=U7PR00_SPOS1|nr:3-oxo-5-alpha-steroid 4-dehydrogenase 3 [Sporothrix schenckii 1099-18]ERS97174.1 hypothetical protein HMPREF1624_06505 [Sporothrix schenckii ATCC 58251]KJR86391.1 3-oxo-5-alpha-steroid 4-dehydrogenase 3 [Sporothrix schenckii 1099-18]
MTLGGFRVIPGGLAPIGSASLSMSPANLCQASFVGLGAAIVALTLLPAATQKLLLDYGARDSKNSTADANAADKNNKDGRPASTPAPGLLERTVAGVVSRLQVPHSWFISFYAFYLLCTSYWAAQWWSWSQAGTVEPKSPDNLFGRILASQQTSDLVWSSTPVASMVLAQMGVAFVLEALQTGRRLYEYLYVFKPSKAKMNAAHFILGFAYYAVMSVAIWVEGSQAILATKHHDASTGSTYAINAEALAKILVGTPLFLLAWVGQYRCHVHLASLKKYSLPDEGLFRYFVSPHYTCEFFLYVALSIVTAPDGRLLNRTLLSSLLFVLAGLGVTADRTKRWYSEKFGAERVAKKWRMIPFIF